MSGMQPRPISVGSDSELGGAAVLIENDALDEDEDAMLKSLLCSDQRVEDADAVSELESEAPKSAFVLAWKRDLQAHLNRYARYECAFAAKWRIGLFSLVETHC